jgi:hypothetical protein
VLRKLGEMGRVTLCGGRFFFAVIMERHGARCALAGQMLWHCNFCITGCMFDWIFAAWFLGVMWWADAYSSFVIMQYIEEQQAMSL